MNFLLALVPGGNVIAAASSALTAFIRFATSAIGAAIIAAVMGYAAGHHVEAKKWASANLEAKLAAAKADLDIANRAADLAKKQAAALGVSNRANEDKVNALTLDLQHRPARHCGLSRDDARRLRDIR